MTTGCVEFDCIVFGTWNPDNNSAAILSDFAGHSPGEHAVVRKFRAVAGADRRNQVDVNSARRRS